MYREYGSEYDWLSNAAFLRDTDTCFVKPDWQLFRSGRDAMKAFARIAGRKTVLLPTLCCESMIVPFELNGYTVEYYKMKEDLSADEAHMLSKLSEGAVLLYMRYFGIPAFSDEFLSNLKAERPDVLIVEDRTHDVLCPRDEGVKPDATLSSLRKWAALPDGGMLETQLGISETYEDSRFGDERCWIMQTKSRYLENYDSSLRDEFLPRLRNSEHILNESGEPVKIGAEYEKLLKSLDFESIIAKRQANVRLLKSLLQPMADAGRLRFIGDAESSTLYLPFFIENRGAVQAAMAGKGVFCPVIWPMPPQTEGICAVSKYVTEHMLGLPCDQRYDEADMRYIAAALQEILGAMD